MVVGSGKHTYRAVPGWGQGPDGHELGLVSAVATDSQDRVYVFNRLPQPAVLVFDRDGRFLRSWGESIFPQPHGIWISPDDRVYLVDSGDHTVRICTTEGQVIQTIGTPGQVGAPGAPFNRPTRAMVGPSGAIYVSDGYGQYRFHKFAPDGSLLGSWGEKGTGPGQFALPHSIWVDGDERVYVCDRENSRVQLFDAEGRFLDQWTDLHRPMEIFIDPEGIVHLAETEHRVSLLTTGGQVLQRWGEKGTEPGQFSDHPHSIWVDRHGDLYITEVTGHKRLQKFARV